MKAKIIVVDDGSDNETRQIYKEYDNIKLVQLEREDKTARTPSRARNAGIKNAMGDYICFLDSDNYYNTTFIEEMLKVDNDIVFCNWEIVGLDNKKIDIKTVWNMREDILKGKPK